MSRERWVSISVPRELRDFLKRNARKDGRSMAHYLAHLHGINLDEVISAERSAGNKKEFDDEDLPWEV